ncbi:MAG TPA: fused MFS/spermidine synthase [Polyangiaceae bacterium]|nr:fused MFS/spermidine synthase [Polyangiaceae bacterium]
MSRALSNLPLLIAAFCSGFAALSYELIWVRVGTFLLGAESVAMGVVLGTFSASLAAGAVLAAHVERRRVLPSRVFVIAELLLCGSAIVHAAAWVTARVPLSIFFAELGSWSVLASSLLFAVTVVMLPGVLMGVTLPMLTAAAPANETAAASTIARLYGANLLGAGSGALFTGSVGLIFAPISTSWFAAPSLNLLAALFVLKTPAQAIVAKESLSSFRALLKPTRMALFSCLVGAASFSLELLLLRVLRMRLGNVASSTVIALLIGSFIVGLGVGGFVFARRSRWMSVTLALATPPAALLLFALFSAGSLPEKLGVVSPEPSAPQFAVSAALLVLTAAPFGYLFPYACAEEQQRLGLGKAAVAGKILCFNACGNLLGSVVTTFVVLDTIGTVRGLLLPAALLLAAGALTPSTGIATRVARSLPALTVLLTFALLPERAIATQRLRRNLIRLAEDTYGIFALTGGENSKRRAKALFAYGVVASSTGGQQCRNTALVLDVIEAIQAKGRSILAAGLGGACHLRLLARRAPSSRLEVVEISPAVLGLARAEYGLPDEMFERVRLGDARAELRTARVDVVYVDVLWPTMQHQGGFLALEFQQEASRALTPAGMMIQWIGKHGVYEFLFETLRTFEAAHGPGWLLRESPSGHLFLVGIKDSRRHAEVTGKLRQLKRTSAGLEVFHTHELLARAPGPVELITEDALPFERVLLRNDAWKQDVLQKAARLFSEAPKLE